MRNFTIPLDIRYELEEMACTFYKPFYWGLDTVFNANVKLNIADIFSLEKYPGVTDIYCILNHPISGLHIVGDIVSVARKARLIQYEVDDGTGVLPCCQWRKKEDSDEGLFIPRLGQLVSIFGRLSEFRDEKQLTITNILPEDDPNIEPLYWMEVALLKKTVYSKPFVVPPSIIQSEHSQDLPEKSSRETIKGTVLSHLTKKGPTCQFTLSDLRSDSELFRACVDRAKSECGKEDEDAIKEELLSVISNLPREGDVIPDLQSHHRETVYKVFSEEKHLLPAILKYMKQREEKPNARCAKLGLQERWIIEHIKQRETFRHLPTSVITKAIEHLVERSEIYPIANKVYSYLK